MGIILIDRAAELACLGGGGRGRACPPLRLTSPTQIKAQLGSSAYLPCKIKNLGDKAVSWIRNRDAHILSVDRYTFIADARFMAWHEAVTQTWTLQIKFVQARDAGSYECQVSTEPKMSHFVHLTVVSPRVTIPGGSEIHVRSGSTVTIKCVVSHALHPPNYVFWYHEDTRVSESSWTGVQQTPLTKVSGEASVASLTITSVDQQHAGNYTCAPAALTPVSATLHVLLNGERPAAMQHGTSGATSFESRRPFYFVSVLAFVELLQTLLR
ncbi:lachesin-like [Penaeus japonicus]|uniref:lachesin-like n=1 Tax=Penaeus japonicus TaxID=27405 RepID=UPI001C71237B|nr:lachesin-like [Penaeus japonicus]